MGGGGEVGQHSWLFQLNVPRTGINKPGSRVSVMKRAMFEAHRLYIFIPQAYNVSYWYILTSPKFP